MLRFFGYLGVFFALWIQTVSPVYAEVDTIEQQLNALETVLSELETHYGMIKYKEEALGVTCAELREKYRNLIQTATTLEEYLGWRPQQNRAVLPRAEFEQLMIGLASELQDGHTNILRPSQRYWTLGLRAAEIQGQLVITGVIDPAYLAGHSEGELRIGDIITHLDGVPVQELAKENMLYVQLATYASRFSRALEATVNCSHRFFRAKNPGQRVQLTLFRPSTQKMVQSRLSWVDVQDVRTVKRFLAAPTEPAGAGFEGNSEKNSKEFVYGLPDSKISHFRQGLEALGFPIGTLTDIGLLINAEIKAGLHKDVPVIDRLSAYTVKMGQKTIGVIRIPSYSPESFLDVELEYRWMSRVIEIFENTTDAMIIDQLGNGGGYVAAVERTVSLFASPQPLDGMLMDFKISSTLLREKESGLLSQSAGEQRSFSELYLSKQELDYLRGRYEAGERWSGFLPYFNAHPELVEGQTAPIFSGRAVYSKPVLVLNDGRSASGGDFMPALLQSNQRALVFGDVSMGLGGPVYRAQDALPGSELFMRCTMGYCVRKDGLPIENMGVVPDIRREVTYYDFATGFKHYALDAIRSSLMMAHGAKDAKKIQSGVDAQFRKFLNEIGVPTELPEKIAADADFARELLKPVQEADPILRSLTQKDAILDRLHVLLSIAHKKKNGEQAQYLSELIQWVESLEVQDLRAGSPCAQLLGSGSDG